MAVQVSPAVAQELAEPTVTWTGLGDGTSWSDGTNWDSGRPPVYNVHVLIPDVPQTSEVVFDWENCCSALLSLTANEPVRVVTQLWVGRGGLVANADLTIPSHAELHLGVSTEELGAAVRVSGLGTVQLRGGAIVVREPTRIESDVRGFGSIGSWYSRAPETVTFTGTVSADTPPDANGRPWLRIATDEWVNTGTLEADGGRLVLSGHWSSAAGRIVTRSGLVELDGVFGGENFASIVNLGGDVRLVGEVDNYGREMVIGASTGDVTAIDHAHINGGKVIVQPGTTFSVNDRVSYQTHYPVLFLTDVTIDGDLALRGHSTLAIVNTLTLNGTMTVPRHTWVSPYGQRTVLTGNANVVLAGGTIGSSTHDGFRLDPTVTVRVPDCASDCWPESRIGFTYGSSESKFDNAGQIVVGRGRAFSLQSDQFVNSGTIDVAVGGRVTVAAEGLANSGALRAEVGADGAGLFKFETSYNHPGARLNGTLMTRLAPAYVPDADDVHEVVAFPLYETPFDTIVTDSPGRVARYHATGVRIEAGSLEAPTPEPPPAPVLNLRPDSEFSLLHLRFDIPDDGDNAWIVARGAEGTTPPPTAGSGFEVRVDSPTRATHWYPPFDTDMSYSVFRRRDDGQTSEPVSVTLRGTRISATVDRTVVTYGKAVTFRGSLVDTQRDGLVDKRVGVWDMAAHQMNYHLQATGAGGAFEISYVPQLNGRLAPIFRGDSTHIGSYVEDYWTFSVRHRVRSWLSAARVARRAPAYLRGRVGPDKSGDVVRLQRWDGEHWSEFRETTLDAESRFSFRLPTRVRGSWKYRVVKPGDQQHITGTGKARQLTVY